MKKGVWEPMIKYQIFTPGGNKTALVFGVEEDLGRRRVIQDAIMARHKADLDGEVEQVGFVREDPQNPQVIMAGGEFCGNATRAAAAYYLGERVGRMELKSSGAHMPLSVGRVESGDVWARMPLLDSVEKSVKKLGDSDLYWVELQGICHLIVPQRKSLPYLQEIFACKNKEDKLKIALNFLEETIEKYSLNVGEAYGVMFLESVVDVLKLHPFVHVKSAKTTHYETACGSGSMCVGLLSAYLREKDINLPILQPSDRVIWVRVETQREQLRGSIFGSLMAGDILEIHVS